MILFCESKASSAFYLNYVSDQDGSGLVYMFNTKRMARLPVNSIPVIHNISQIVSRSVMPNVNVRKVLPGAQLS